MPTSFPDILPAFRREVERHGLLLPHERVLVAVSAGGDSVALLHLLAEYSRNVPLELNVAHVNHRQRGPASDADERFVSELAGGLGYPCLLLEGDPSPGGAPGRGSSPASEEALRRKRHALLARAARDRGCSRIALGHTMDDQAETVLMRLMRGAGRRGLAAMAWSGPGRLVRPLLGMRRAALRAWLTAHDRPWRQDVSNADPRYLRNRVRSGLLPEMERCNPAIVEVLSRTAGVMRDEDALLDGMTREGLKGAVRRFDGRVAVTVRALAALPLPLARRGVRILIGMAGGDPRGADTRTVARILALARGGSLSDRGISGGMCAVRDGDELVFAAAGTTRAPEPFCIEMRIPGEVTIPSSPGILTARIVDRSQVDWTAPGPDRACLDADRLGDVVTIRSRRPGDRFHPLGGPGGRRLKEFFIDGKVPRSLRDRIPLVEGPSGIAWVVGERIGEPYRLTGATRRVALLEWSQGGSHRKAHII